MAFTWATVNRAGSTHPLYDCICVGAGKFVAVGSGGRVVTSSDSGQTWQTRTASSANDWGRLAFDGTTVVAVSAVGAGTRAMFSTDLGHTWTASTTVPEANHWVGVCSPSVGVFVAVSDNGTHRVMRSTNSGVTWAAISASSALLWGGIATNGSIIVAKDANDVMISSDAGLSWTTYLSACPSYNGQASEIKYSTTLSKFVGFGYNGSFQAVVYASTNGQSWALLSTITTHFGWGGSGLTGFVVADSIGGFIGSLPFTSAFVSTPKIVAWTDDGAATWTVEDTTFAADVNGWDAAAWDPATATVVFFNDATEAVLVGTGSFAPPPEVIRVDPSRGTWRGNTLVTVTGENFTPSTVIKFDGVAAVGQTYMSSTIIGCRTPSHGVRERIEVEVTAE